MFDATRDTRYNIMLTMLLPRQRKMILYALSAYVYARLPAVPLPFRYAEFCCCLYDDADVSCAACREREYSDSEDGGGAKIRADDEPSATATRQMIHRATPCRKIDARCCRYATARVKSSRLRRPHTSR